MQKQNKIYSIAKKHNRGFQPWAAEINKDWNGAYRATASNEKLVVNFWDKEAARIDYTGGRYIVSGIDKDAIGQLEYMINR